MAKPLRGVAEAADALQIALMIAAIIGAILHDLVIIPHE
jgi:hypothetical protein